MNIAEILKDCPKGMELDCTNYDGIVTFEKVNDCLYYPITISVKNGDQSFLHSLTKYGQTCKNPYNKCVIFPKGKTTWEGFVPPCKFKDGDVCYVKTKTLFEYIFIFKVSKNYDDCTENYVTLSAYELYTDISSVCTTDCIKEIRLATEEEKQKLFYAIKANGYRWNAETKTLEKLITPKFKVGDRVRHKTTNKNDIYEISKVYDDSYGLVGFTWMVYMKYQDQYELVPNKFDITTLNPFDKVLVRHNKDNKWCCSLFSHIDKDLHSHCYKYVTIAGKSYPYCIPYDANKELRGTTNDCNEYYKIWEE